MSDPEDVNPGEMSPPNHGSYQQSNISLVRELSPDQHLQEMVYQLQGKMWDPVSGQYKKLQDVEPFMNQKGINAFYQYATAVLSPIVTMSNYTNKYDMIHALMRLQMNRAVKHFYIHYADYGIQKTQVNVITTKLMILGLSAFYKAIGAGDRKAATSNIHETIQHMMKGESGGGSNEQTASSGGFISKLFGGK